MTQTGQGRDEAEHADHIGATRNKRGPDYL